MIHISIFIIWSECHNLKTSTQSKTISGRKKQRLKLREINISSSSTPTETKCYLSLNSSRSMVLGLNTRESWTPVFSTLGLTSLINLSKIRKASSKQAPPCLKLWNSYQMMSLISREHVTSLIWNTHSFWSLPEIQANSLPSNTISMNPEDGSFSSSLLRFS